MDFIEEKIVALFDAGAESVTIDEEGRGSENYLAKCSEKYPRIRVFRIGVGGRQLGLKARNAPALI